MIDNAIVVEIDFPNEIDVDLGEAKFITAPARKVPQATPEIHISESGLITASATQEEGMVLAGTKSAELQMPTKSGAIIEPSKETQVAIRKGEYAVGDISVNPISDEYIKPSGTLEITENNKEYNVAEFETANVKIAIQSKFSQLVDRTITEVTAEDLEGITEIMGYAFYDCRKLERVILPNGVVSIAGSAFADCRAMTHIELPAGLKRLGVRTFQTCSKLTYLVFKEGFESTTNYSIQGCGNLEIVDFPSTTISLNSNSITSCTALKKIIVRATTPPRATNPLFGSIGEAKIYVPAESVEAYKSATNWSVYADRIFAIEE